MKFGIIGTNFVSDFFMDGAKQETRCEIVAVCSISLEEADKFADKYNIEHRFDDYKKMAEANLIEAVYIAVPNGLHKDITCYFLEKKIPVFCEKPMASNIDEVRCMIDTARANNTYLHEGLIPLYNPNFKIVKETIAKVGKIHQVLFNFSKYSSRYDAYLRKENPTTFRADLSNGAIMDLGVYIFADCIGLFGKPKQVFSACELLDTKADVSGTSIFVYDDFVATLAYSKASDTKVMSEINGELGSIIIDQPSQPQVITFVDRINKTETIISVKPQENFYYELKMMIDCVEAGLIENEACSHQTSLDIHDVLTECRRQANLVFPADKK
ncbi:MAG: Gfo/Idh/MocA family oxidoreductase [Erysipelotrichaceae bacterium]